APICGWTATEGWPWSSSCNMPASPTPTAARSSRRSTTRREPPSASDAGSSSSPHPLRERGEGRSESQFLLRLQTEARLEYRPGPQAHPQARQPREADTAVRAVGFRSVAAHGWLPEVRRSGRHGDQDDTVEHQAGAEDAGHQADHELTGEDVATAQLPQLA